MSTALDVLENVALSSELENTWVQNSKYSHCDHTPSSSHLVLNWKLLKQRQDASLIILFNNNPSYPLTIHFCHVRLVFYHGQRSLISPSEPRPGGGFVIKANLSKWLHSTHHMHTKHIIRPLARIDTNKHSFIPRAASIWNNLPQ